MFQPNNEYLFNSIKSRLKVFPVNCTMYAAHNVKLYTQKQVCRVLAEDMYLPNKVYPHFEQLQFNLSAACRRSILALKKRDFLNVGNRSLLNENCSKSFLINACLYFMV